MQVAPTARAGGWLAAAGRHPRLCAGALGALAALALPPFNFWPCLLAFAGLLYLVRAARRPWQAALLGWCFGFGHFLVGLYWIAIAFFTDAERFGLLAVPAILLLCAGLAFYPALATGLTALRRWRSATAGALALAIAWTASEVLRGTLFGGFPWNLIGYAFAGSDAISQLAAVAGVWGLSLLAVLIGALPAALLAPGGRARWWPAGAAALMLVLLWSGGALRLAGAGTPPAPGPVLRLVQGNIAQHHKWQPELRAQWFKRHLDLSAQAGDGVQAVIWPESASSYALDQEPEARRLIGRVVPPGGLLLTGGERFDFDSQPPRAWNSLFVLDPIGTIVAHYDKHDLVPFGEFLPLRGVLGRLGLNKVTGGTVDFRAGPGRTTLTLPGLPPFSPLICYEAIFPGAVVDRDARPAWLLNITNDAWFGRSSGPYQHLAMARLRAVEEGLPLVRSANTGVSVVVDPFGRIVARLDLGTSGVLDAALPAPLAAPPPFARYGLWVVVALACLAAATAVIAEIFAARAAREVNKPAKSATTSSGHAGMGP